MWRDLLPYLEPHLRLYPYDLKGFGLSSKPQDGRYSIEDQAAIVAAFFERLHLTNVCLCGHSMGGAVALTAYLRLADAGQAGRIRALVLIAAPAAVQELPFFISALKNPFLRPLFRLIPNRARARWVLRKITFDPRRVTKKHVERYARFHALPGSQRALVASARQIIPPDPDTLTARLDDIRVPTLLVWGEFDPVVPRWQADVMKRRIPDSRLVLLPECGHLPPEECPERLSREILRFLAGQPPAPPSPPCG